MSNEYPPYPDQPEGQNTPGAGGDSLPSFPTGPTQQGPAPTIEQPQSIASAVRLMWVGAAISLISMLYSLTTIGSLKDDVRRQLADQGQKVTDSAVNAGFAIGIVVAVGAGIVGILLWLWMAWKNSQGRSWARIVATVLGAINVLFTLLSLSAGTGEFVASILTIVNLVVAVVILYFLWQKSSTAFYEATTRRDAQYGRQ